MKIIAEIKTYVNQKILGFFHKSKIFETEAKNFMLQLENTTSFHELAFALDTITKYKNKIKVLENKPHNLEFYEILSSALSMSIYPPKNTPSFFSTWLPTLSLNFLRINPSDSFRP